MLGALGVRRACENTRADPGSSLPAGVRTIAAPQARRLLSQRTACCMADITRLPDGCRSVTHLPLEGAPFDVMEAARGCLAGMGALKKTRPFSLTAQVWATDGQTDVIVKARAYKDSTGTFLDVTRRRGDSVLFARVFMEIERALGERAARSPPNADLSIYEHWPEDAVKAFEADHQLVSQQVRAGRGLSAKAFQEHVSRVPWAVRAAKIGWAGLRRDKACVCLDEICCEATAYWASLA